MLTMLKIYVFPPTMTTRGYPNLDRYPNLGTGGIAKKKMLLLA